MNRKSIITASLAGGTLLLAVTMPIIGTLLCGAAAVYFYANRED